ncbi:MAG: 3-phosphoshikimate 1-carboxyvinyltransferase [Desulfobacterales bacterium]|nr:3-phosphoshikimate 1-carboxyvinyltransferase [Desulfobacterales bacterium]
MKLRVEKTGRLAGEIRIPASKSHTIRGVIVAALARGRSELVKPLFSEDTRAIINAFRAIGAKIERSGDNLVIDGCGADAHAPSRPLDMLNSGTSTNLTIGILAALGVGGEITGDASLRSRPVAALTRALTGLGCRIRFLDQEGCPPLAISGRIQGGEIELDASKSSQYVSSLLMAAPLALGRTELRVKNPTELPYIDMTLKWLDEQGIAYERDGYDYFKIDGGQAYTPIQKAIPADWSSAAFPICAAAVAADSDVLVKGVDVHDIQGDKAILDYLGEMGADVTLEEGGVRIRGKAPRGKTLDINATPDALPALSVIGCRAAGETRLLNVAHARVKETDRIAVMARELQKMGGDVRELPDGLVIRQSDLNGAEVRGHHDHRVVMSLSIAGLLADGPTLIDTAEAVSVTYPDYVESMRRLGANFRLVEVKK